MRERAHELLVLVNQLDIDGWTGCGRWVSCAEIGETTVLQRAEPIPDASPSLEETGTALQMQSCCAPIGRPLCVLQSQPYVSHQYESQ